MSNDDKSNERRSFMRQLARIGKNIETKSLLRRTKKEESYESKPEKISPLSSLLPSIRVDTNMLQNKGANLNEYFLTEQGEKKPDKNSHLGMVSDKKEPQNNVIKVHVIDLETGKRLLFLSPKSAFFKEVNSFQEVAGEITLECNIMAYKWFHRWLKVDPSLTLDAFIIMSLLKFADNLMISRLVDICLRFWRLHIDDVKYEDNDYERLRDDTKILFTKLFMNKDIEELKQHPYLQNQLYKNYIYLLNHQVPNNKIGHYYSTFNLFRCVYCGKILSRKMADIISCQYVTVSIKGDVQPRHKEATDWSLSGLVQNLWTNLKSYQQVYWRLWGLCHYIHCSACNELFPLCQMHLCRFHSNTPCFSTEKKVGYFPCCKKPAYHFEAVFNNTGCQCQPHVPSIRSTVDGNILAISKAHGHLIADDSPISYIQPMLYKRMSKPPVASFTMYRVTALQQKKKREKDKWNGWSNKLSTGFNQDNQREIEEKNFRQLQSFLTSKCSREKILSPRPPGGSYIFVEGEWWRNFGCKGGKGNI